MKSVFIVFQLFLLTIFSSIIIAQEDNFPKLNQNELSEGKIVRTEIYVGQELWGLINGGADLYLEYGLDRTLLQEIVQNEKIYRIEIYGMNSVDAAFGIYSINKFNCDLPETFTKHICITPYQLQAAVGRFYISISNESGDSEAQNFSTLLLDGLLSKIEIEEFALPEYFRKPQFEQYINQVKLIKGKLGLQNGFPKWEKYFESLNDYEIVLLPIKAEEGFINIALVTFNSDEDVEKFLSSNTNFKLLNTVSEKELVLLESNLDQKNIDKIIN